MRRSRLAGTSSTGYSTHNRFLQAREAATIQEIRRVCGVAEAAPGVDENMIADDVTEDVRAGDGSLDDEEEDVEDIETAFG